MIKKILLFGILSFFFAFPVRAADVEIECNTGGCTHPAPPPLFSSAFIWAPGYNQTKTIRVANTGGDSLAVSNKAVNFFTTGDLDNVLGLTIRRFTDGTIVFHDSLHNFYSVGNLALSSLGANSSDEFYYTVEMDPEAGNEYQSKVTKFDLNLNFSGGHEDNQNNNNQSSTDNGSPGVPRCDKTSPAVPGNLHVTASTANSITLAWNGVSPVTHYALIFTRLRDGAKYGSPNIGNVNNYTIHNLAGGETYEFEILAVNDCAPGPAAKMTATVLGGAVEGRPRGENNEVLGVETTPTPTITDYQPAAVLGENNCVEPKWKMLFVILTFIAAYAISRKQSGKKWLAMLVLLAGVAYIVDKLFFCDHKPWFLIVLAIGFVVKTGFLKKR